MTRLPLIPTLLVAAAVATMIALGFWQLDRKQEKEALLASFTAAQGLPAIALPMRPDPSNPPLFRQATAFCAAVTGWRSASGRNGRGEPGWVHIASCDSGADGDFQAVMGWSTEPQPPDWKGGPVTGIIGPDSRHTVRLVAAEPAPGLARAARPSPADIPNNHLGYAIQWFFFAATAALIYALALRRRRASKPE